MTLLACLAVIIAIPVCGTAAVVLMVRAFGARMPSVTDKFQRHGPDTGADTAAEG